MFFTLLVLIYIRLFTVGSRQEDSEQVPTPISFRVKCPKPDTHFLIATLNWKIRFSWFHPQIEHILQWAVGYNRTLPPNPHSAATPKWERQRLVSARNIAIQHALTENRWNVIPSWHISNITRFQTKKKGKNGKVTKFQALIVLNGDVVYHFRVLSKSGNLYSLPSITVPPPNIDSNVYCYILPKPPSVVPMNVCVYGKRPNFLRITWNKIPNILHNGPGLIYNVSVQCLTCENSSIGEFNHEFKNDVSQFNLGSGIELRTRKLKGKLPWNYEVDGFQKYKVTLLVSNSFGPAPSGPVVVTGFSGELPPTQIVTDITLLAVTSNLAIVSWLKVETDMKITNGIFRGYLLNWCIAKQLNQQCISSPKYINYIVQEFLPETLPYKRISNSEVEQFITHIGAVRSVGSYYHGLLSDLPEDTQFSINIRVRNIQYLSKSDSYILGTTTKAIPGLQVSHLKSTELKIIWESSDENTKSERKYIVDIYEIFQIPNSEIVEFLSYTQTLKVRLNTMLETSTNIQMSWIIGLQADTNYSVSLRIEDENIGSSLKLRTRRPFDSQKSELYPFSVKLSSVVYGQMNVCLSDNVIFCVPCGMRENMPDQSILSTSAEPITFAGEYREIENKMWIRSEFMPPTACVQIGNHKELGPHEVRVVLMHGSTKQWISNSKIVDVLEMLGVEMDVRKKLRKLHRIGHKIFMNIVSFSIIIGLLGMVVFAIYGYVYNNQNPILTNVNARQQVQLFTSRS